MVWAILVALGVAIVSMTLFASRFTRRPTQDAIVEHVEVEADPNDPWAAWKPRPFEELDRPRQRVWPVLAAFTGLIMVGAGFAGARQTLWARPADQALDAPPTPRPYTVEVDIPATPSPKPTPVPTVKPATPAPTVAPQPAATTAPASPSSAPTAAPSGPGPTLTGTAGCGGGNVNSNYSASSSAGLKWIAVYVDGEVVKGGPISGTSHSSSYNGPASSGTHDLEVSVEDKTGKTTRKQFQVNCP